MTSPSAAPANPGGWRFIDSAPADGATNMAIDVALLEHARRTGESTFRVYAWSTPTLSFGRHEATRGRFSAAALEAAGVDVVRRPTGGRALLHHRELTYSVTAPIAGRTLPESYRGINALLVDALARLGVAAAPAARGARARRPGTVPCFAEPNEGELVVAGAKLVGSAQWREGDALLQHGSILIDDDQAGIAALQEDGAGDGTEGADRAPVARVATLNALVGRRSGASGTPDALRTALRDALLEALRDRCRRDGVTSPALVESDSGTSDAIATHRALFCDASWTWRR